MRVLLLLPAILATSCLDPLALEVEAPDACVSKSGVELGFAPTQSLQVLPVAPVTARQRVELPVEELATSAFTEGASVRLNSVTMSATRGDFSSIAEIEVAAVDPSRPDAVPVELLRHQLSGETDSVVMTASHRPDLTTYVRNGELDLELAMTTRSWTGPLTVDLEACFALAISR